MFSFIVSHYHADGYHTPQPPTDSLQAMDLNLPSQQQQLHQQQPEVYEDGGGGGLGGVSLGGVLGDYSFDDVQPSLGNDGREEEPRGVNNNNNEGDTVNAWYDTDL